MLRRDPEAVVTAHVMDRSRRELYVEGSRDRCFLAWLLAEEQDPNISVREMAFVDLPGDVSGGERGRIIRFAEWLGERDVQIRFFADADWDRLLGRPVPRRVWLTDHRDMEGYVLRLECIDKVLRLGIGTDRIPADDLLRMVREQGRRLGLIRLMSELDSLRLPFQATRLRRFLGVDGGRIGLNLDGYLRALLQNARISLRRLAEMRARLRELEATFGSTPDSEVIHGRDATCIIEAALSSCGVRPDEGTRLLWTSFEVGFVEEGSTLHTVTSFLRRS